MSTDSEWQDSCDDEPDIDSYQCYVSITRLTEEEIEKWTNPALIDSANNNSLTTIDHNYSVSSITYDSDATTVEDFDLSRPEGSVKKAKTDWPTSLYDDDEIISIELDKNTKKKVQIYDKCTIPDKLVSRYNSLKKRNSSTLPLFCLFCLKEYYQVNQVLSCHYQQAKHFPFRCVECEESTLDTKSMIQHYTKTHPTLTHVQYRRSFAPAKERWARKFVIYQLKCITNQAIMIPNGILHKYCPVCNQWDYKLGDKYPKNKPKHKLFTVLDKNHIHKHLKYHPFQCLLCLKKNVRCDFTVVNRKARLHLINCHEFQAPTEQDLKDNFDSLGMIPELERYINSYVKFVQESFTRQTFRLSPIADTSSQTPKKILSTSPSLVSTKQSTPLSILSGGKKSGSSGKASKAVSKLTASKKRRHEYSIDDMYYPSPKYARRDCSKPKNGKKSSLNNYSTDSSVIDLDSFYEDSSNPYLKPDQAPRIICIFCNYQVTDILAAWDHYATHLDYRPITCQLCHKSFPGPKAFQLHGSDHVDHDNLPYTWHHDEIIEAWSRDFLNSIINDINANPEFACFCPICCKKFQKQKVFSQKLSYEDVRKHIFAHLRYQPYHCNLCTGDKVFVADLDNEGVRHLTFHEIVCSKEELPNHFTRSRGIEAVDSFLSEHFKKIRILFNTPGGNIIADGNLSNDPLCDVESLFNSLQETLGHNTLNNILDNVSTSEDRPSNQLEPAIDYPCTPSSTTSDPVIASSPIEPYQASLPPSPIKPIATVTNESSDTMIPSASESSTSAESSPAQESEKPAECQLEKVVCGKVNIEPDKADSEKLNANQEDSTIDNEKVSCKQEEVGSVKMDIDSGKVDSEKMEISLEKTDSATIDFEKVNTESDKVDSEKIDHEKMTIVSEKVNSENIESEKIDLQKIDSEKVNIESDKVNSEKVDPDEENLKIDNEKVNINQENVNKNIDSEKVDAEKNGSEQVDIGSDKFNSEMVNSDQENLTIDNEKVKVNIKQEMEYSDGVKMIIGSERIDSEKIDFEKGDSEKVNSEKIDSGKLDIVKEKVNFEKIDSQNVNIESDKVNLEKVEPSQEDSHTDSEKVNINQENVSSDVTNMNIGSEKVETVKIGSEKIDSEKMEIGLEKTDSATIDFEKVNTESDKVDSEKIDHEKMTIVSEKVNSENIESEKIDLQKIDSEKVNIESDKVNLEKVEPSQEDSHTDSEKVNINQENVSSDVTNMNIGSEKVETVKISSEKVNTHSGKVSSQKVDTNQENPHIDSETVNIKQEKIYPDANMDIDTEKIHAQKKPSIKAEKVDSSTITNNIKSEKLHPACEKVNMRNSNASKRDSTGSVKAGTPVRRMPARKGKAVVENKSTNTSPKPPEIKEIKLRSKTIVSTGTPSSRTRSKTTKVTTATQTRSF